MKLGKVCQTLKLRPHKIKLDDGKEITMFSSIECKGIIGNDGRLYVLDLLRTFPLDLNYIEASSSDTQKSEYRKFPRKFRHRLCSLRQELVEAFIDTKYVQFVKHAAYSFQEQKKLIGESEDPAVAAQNNEKEIEDAKKLVRSLTSPASVAEQESDEKNNEIIKEACKSISSLKTNEFDIRLNTNLYQPIVKLTDDEDLLNLDKKLLKEASDFIVHVQIPSLVCRFRFF